MYDIDLPVSTKSLINRLIEEHNFENIDVCVSNGSEKGDNYVSDVFRIKIISNINGSILLSLILKTNTPNDARKDALPLPDFYNREANLYNIILPAFEKFQNDNNISTKDFFKYAKCYSANDEHVLLEDLSVKSFKMHSRFNSFDENHLILVLTTLARYHAISFALKEKEFELYQNLSKLVEKSVIGDFFDPMLEGIIPKTISILKDEKKIAKLKEFSNNIITKYHSYIDSNTAHPYNVICHGDCWNNNLLFRYEDDVPVEIMFLDWQISRHSSPVTDITYMIYSSTYKSIRDKLGSKIFDVYYDSLTLHLKNFGCDVKKCYPYDVFKDHVNKIWPLGLVTGMIGIPLTLSQKGNELDLTDMTDFNEKGKFKMQYDDNMVSHLEDLIDEFINLKFI